MLVWLSAHARPVGGVTLIVRTTVCSVNPLSDATVMVEFPVAPDGIVTVVGLAETAKSSTLNVTVTE